MISDSERFYGYNRTRFNQDGNFTHHEKAQLASLGDKVEVYAGKDYRQTSAKFYQKIKRPLMHKILLWIQLLILININKVKAI